MQQGPDGLQPTDNFLENAMAPRPSFNDNSEPGESVLASALSDAPESRDIYMNGSHEHGIPARHDWDRLSLTLTLMIVQLTSISHTTCCSRRRKDPDRESPHPSNCL